MNSHPQQDLVTAGEAAALLGLSTTRLSTLARAGRIRPVLEGSNCRVYTRAEVDAFAAARVEQSKTDARVKVPIPS